MFLGLHHLKGDLDDIDLNGDKWADLIIKHMEKDEEEEYDSVCTNGHDLCYQGTQDDCPYCEKKVIKNDDR